MDELVPCRFCRNRPNRYPLTTQEGVEEWRVLHHCQGRLRPSEDEAVSEWNAGNVPAAPDPALLALARFGAGAAQKWWLLVDDIGGGFDDAGGFALDRMAVAAGIMVDTDYYNPAPGIAAAIAALLAPDGAGDGGVTP